MSDPQNRDIRIISQPSEQEEETRRGRNIVAVVGIDKYQNLQLLHNAVSDAKGVRALFIDQLGFQELAPPLCDDQATRDAINSMVVDSLNSQLEPEDSLVFFFAGHGYTETRTVGTRTKQTGYLIPVEGASLDQGKFSTYLRLDAFLEEVANLPAMHILVILDACHSGFALGESVQVLRDVQRYSDDLSKRMSRRVIASAMSDQPALDNGPVSGHSLFTGTLVEALAQGKADADNKGFVTSSETALYVQRNVAAWSSSQQTPDFGSFELDDRGELVISLVGETQSRLLAHEALAIADQIFALGWLTNERKRFLFAAKQYREALRHAMLGKIELPAAELGLGRALCAAGEIEEAIKTLTDVAQHSEDAAAKKLLTRLKKSATDDLLKDLVDKIVGEMPELKATSLDTIATFLEEAIGKREARDDLWPEGRLQLGITYAARKDYPAAKRTLDEVIRICESGGKFMEQHHMAA